MSKEPKDLIDLLMMGLLYLVVILAFGALIVGLVMER
jgi:hypothetical protein